MLYIDPNAGSIVLQALAAGAITLLTFFGRVRERIGAVVRRIRQR